jgi:CelD/BcsL family acetyltransferase involved in cellulose biosynthesis
VGWLRLGRDDLSLLMLLMHVIRDVCGDGIKLFDFIYGDADYKHFWATDCHEIYRASAGRGFTGRLAVLLSSAQGCRMTAFFLSSGWNGIAPF